jgi:hypothetical protein
MKWCMVPDLGKICNFKIISVECETRWHLCKNVFVAFSLTAITRAGNIKIVMKINYKHSYKLCMIYCLQANILKNGDSAIFRGYIWQT